MSDKFVSLRLNRTSRNAAASVAGYIVPMVVNFVTAPILLHNLGEAAYGLQSLVAVVIGYFAVMDTGLDLPIIKYLAEDHAHKNVDSENHLLSTTLQIYIAIGLLAMVILFLSAEWFATILFKVPPELEEQAVWVFRLAGIGVLGSVGLSWGRAVGMGLQCFEMTYGVSIVTNLAGAVFGLLTVFAGYGIVGYVFWRVLWSFLGIFVYYGFTHHMLPAFQLRWGIDRGVLRRVRGYIGYGAINRVVGSFGGRIDQTLIAVWLGVATAGIYALPFMLVSSLGYMLAYMVGFIFPMASELHSQGKMVHLCTILTRTTAFLAALACMTFIPLMIFGESFLRLWLGPEIADQVAPVLILLALSTFISTLSVTLLNSVNIGIGRMRESTIYGFCRIVVIGVGCFFFIHPLGLVGAGLAFLLSNGVDIVYMVISLHKFLSMSLLALLRAAYWKPLALGLLLSIPALAVRPLSGSWINLIVFIGLYLFAYVGLGFRVGIFGDVEKRAVLSLWGTARAAFS